ncbi:MAG: hypothetical protein QF535_13410, partial [Anaerolineales bacterium]|nr:hypothetical protein [Anaerolineales bacterium]
PAGVSQVSTSISVAFTSENFGYYLSNSAINVKVIQRESYEETGVLPENTAEDLGNRYKENVGNTVHSEVKCVHPSNVYWEAMSFGSAVQDLATVKSKVTEFYEPVAADGKRANYGAFYTDGGVEA